MLLLLALISSVTYSEGFFLGLKTNLLTSASAEVEVFYPDFSNTIDAELEYGSIAPVLLVGYGVALGPGELRPSFEYQLINTEYSVGNDDLNIDSIEYNSLGLNIDYIYDINQQIGIYSGLSIIDFNDETDNLEDLALPSNIVFGLNFGGVYSINNIDVDASFRYYLSDIEEENYLGEANNTITFSPEYILGLSINYYLSF